MHAGKIKVNNNLDNVTPFFTGGQTLMSPALQNKILICTEISFSLSKSEATRLEDVGAVDWIHLTQALF